MQYTVSIGNDDNYWSYIILMQIIFIGNLTGKLITNVLL